MRSLLRFTILLIAFGYGWGLPKISLDGMDSAIQGKSISQHKPFQNLKGLRIAYGSIGYFFNMYRKLRKNETNVEFLLNSKLY